MSVELTETQRRVLAHCGHPQRLEDIAFAIYSDQYTPVINNPETAEADVNILLIDLEEAGLVKRFPAVGSVDELIGSVEADSDTPKLHEDSVAAYEELYGVDGRYGAAIDGTSEWIWFTNDGYKALTGEEPPAEGK